jgi:hypothetical protein
MTSPSPSPIWPSSRGDRPTIAMCNPERPALAIEVADSALYGWRHRSVASLAPPAFVVPLAFASSRIAVADLLP